MHQYGLVIFDCDGVLIDSEIIACGADAEALSQAGYPTTTSEISHRFAGVPSAEMYRIIEAEAGISLPDDIEDRVRATILEKYRSELQPIDGAATVLSSLNVPKCVASSSAPAKLALGLVESGLYELVYPHVFSTHLVSRGKPYPDIFEYAAQKMDVAREQCLVVEDSVAGATAAVAAGMDCVGFIGGSHCQPGLDGRLRKAGAKTIITSLRDVLTFVPHN